MENIDAYTNKSMEEAEQAINNTTEIVEALQEEQAYSYLQQENIYLKIRIRKLAAMNSSLDEKLMAEKSLSAWFKEQLSQEADQAEMAKIYLEELDKDGQKLLAQEDEIKKLTRKLQELKEENGQLANEAAQVPGLKSEIKELNVELEKMARISQSLITQLLSNPEMHTEFESLKAEFEKVTNENASLNEDLKRAKSELAEAKRLIQSLQNDATPLECEKDEFLCSMSKLSKEIKRARFDLTWATMQAIRFNMSD